MRVVLLAALLVACGASTGDDAASTFVALEVEPAMATLQSDGGPASLDYTVIGLHADGRRTPVTGATLSLDTDGSALGAFADATFTAHGRAAGKGGVLAQLDGLVATASVIVEVHVIQIGAGVPADAPTKFPATAPSGAQSPTTVYPLDGAVMPSSVKAPDIQWEGASGTSDLYRVRMTSGFATVDSFVAAPPGFTFNLRPSDADWRLLATTSGGATVSFTIDHWDATNGAHGGAPVLVQIAPADVSGVIYYWNLVGGQMERISDTGRSVAIPNPPPSVSGDGVRCVACHTVSRDGRYLAGGIGHAGEPAGVFDMSDPLVASADPAPTESVFNSGSYRALFMTFNPDATRLLVNANHSLALVDPQAGTSVSTNGTPLPATNASHPVWSPDGLSVAYVKIYNDGANPISWAVDYTHGDLALIPAAANDSFGPSSTIVASSTGDARFTAPSWPSFAPDSRWIAFGAGVHSRGKLNTTENPGALFVVDKTGGPPRQLDTACASALRCYLPNFSPYDAGGYYWLVFYSFRDYGNAQAGTKGTGRRQMWITAISKTALAGGGDPSSVPYWVPDQDRLTENMSAFWSLPAPLL